MNVVGQNTQEFISNNSISVFDGNRISEFKKETPKHWTRLQKKLMDTILIRIPVGTTMEAINKLLDEIQKEVPGIQHYINPRIGTTMTLQIQLIGELFEMKGCVRDLYSFLSNPMGLEFLIALWRDELDRREDKPNRLSLEQYNRIVKPITPKVLSEKCSICCESYSSCSSVNENKTVVTKCGHIFHDNCLKNWLTKMCNKPTCPICRCDLS